MNRAAADKPVSGGTTPPLVELRDVSKRFDTTQALQAVSLPIEAGSIHCLLGENGAGKSTLGKIIAGVHRADSGSLLIDGRAVAMHGVAQARTHGITIVFQELSLAPDLSVAENICLGTERRFGRALLDRGAEQARCRAVLRDLDLNLDLAARTGDLPIAQQQLVEIAKALQLAPRMIVLDEPTAMLGAIDKDKLFAIITRLRAAGTTFLFITHHLDEVLQLGDRVTILRDGRLVETLALHAAMDADTILEKVSGRARAPATAAATAPTGSPVLTIDGLCGPDGQARRIEVRRGEIVGLYGVVGCGREAVVHAVVGQAPARALSLRFEGVPYRPTTPVAARRAGIGYLPTGRAANCVLPSMSVRENLTISQLGRFQHAGLLDAGTERAAAQQQLAGLHTRMASPEDPITSLSGGNQQKVMLGRCLAAASRLLVLEDPTAGIDVAAKRDIHDLLRGRARDGLAVLFVSSDLRETLALCTTVHTFFEGRLMRTYPAPSPSDEAAIVADVLGNLAAPAAPPAHHAFAEV